MAWFRCFIRGDNFPGALAGLADLVGFYTTRFVEAGNRDDAEARALELLRAESRLAPPPGYQPRGIACVVFEKITEVPAASVPARQPGFAWYPMEADA